jgi:hypothetical protein
MRISKSNAQCGSLLGLALGSRCLGITTRWITPPHEFGSLDECAFYGTCLLQFFAAGRGDLPILTREME